MPIEAAYTACFREAAYEAYFRETRLFGRDMNLIGMNKMKSLREGSLKSFHTKLFAESLWAGIYFFGFFDIIDY